MLHASIRGGIVVIENAATRIAGAGLGKPAAALAAGELLEAIAPTFDQLVSRTTGMLGSTRYEFSDRLAHATLDAVSILDNGSGRAVQDAWTGVARLTDEAQRLARITGDERLHASIDAIHETVVATRNLVNASVGVTERRVLDGAHVGEVTANISHLDLPRRVGTGSVSAYTAVRRITAAAADEFRVATRLAGDASERIASVTSIDEVVRGAIAGTEEAASSPRFAGRSAGIRMLAETAQQLQATYIDSLPELLAPAFRRGSNEVQVDVVAFTRHADAAARAHAGIITLLDRARELVPEQTLNFASVRTALDEATDTLAQVGKTVERVRDGASGIITSQADQAWFHASGDDMGWLRVFESHGGKLHELESNGRMALRDAFQVKGLFVRNASVRPDAPASAAARWSTADLHLRDRLDRLAQAATDAVSDQPSDMLGTATNLVVDDILARVRSTYGNADELRAAIGR